MIALLYPAFKLHERAGSIEERERSLKQMMEVVSRREKVNDDRERDLRDLAVRLEQASQATKEKPPRELAPILVDDSVRQAGFKTLDNRANLHPTTD